MSSGPDKVQAGVHTQVGLLLSLGLLLLTHVGLVLVIDKLNDGLPGVPVVDIVSKPRRVNDRQPDLEELLLQLRLCNINLHRLAQLLLMAALMIRVVLDGRGEERIDEGRLSKARLAGYHNGEVGAALGDNLVSLARISIGSQNGPLTWLGRFEMPIESGMFDMAGIGPDESTVSVSVAAIRAGVMRDGRWCWWRRRGRCGTGIVEGQNTTRYDTIRYDTIR